MITDDAMFMRVTLKNLLVKNGYDVVGEASNGREAVEQYAACRPDLVLMDITMPVLDGIAATREIREKRPSRQSDYVYRDGPENMVVEAIQAGAKDFIVKPFLPDRVLESIQKLIGLRPMGREGKRNNESGIHQSVCPGWLFPCWKWCWEPVPPRNMTAQADMSMSQQCNVVCGVTGEVQGQVIFGMSLVTADKVASTMLGQTIKTFDALAASAIGELGNMISGNAMQHLSKRAGCATSRRRRWCAART